MRLLGPFDPFLQARDREVVVPDPAHRKDLWRTLGRPGGVLVDETLQAALAAHDREFVVRRGRTVTVRGYTRLDSWSLNRRR